MFARFKKPKTFDQIKREYFAYEELASRMTSVSDKTFEKWHRLKVAYETALAERKQHETTDENIVRLHTKK